MHRCITLLTLTAAGLLSAPPARAQVLSGRAVLTPAQAPASNTLVVMVSDSALVVALARTDSTGVFAMQPGRPGTYRLVFFRQGEGSVVTPAITLDSAADVQREFQIPGASGARVPLYFAGDVDKPVAPAGGSAPGYPGAYAARGVGGFVRALFIVNARGRIEKESAQIVGATNAAFAEAVRRTLDGLRFLPAEHRGQKVAQLFQYTFDFGCPGDPMVGDVIIRTYLDGCRRRK